MISERERDLIDSLSKKLRSRSQLWRVFFVLGIWLKDLIIIKENEWAKVEEIIIHGSIESIEYLNNLLGTEILLYGLMRVKLETINSHRQNGIDDVVRCVQPEIIQGKQFRYYLPSAPKTVNQPQGHILYCIIKSTIVEDILKSFVTVIGPQTIVEALTMNLPGKSLMVSIRMCSLLPVLRLFTPQQVIQLLTHQGDTGCNAICRIMKSEEAVELLSSVIEHLDNEQILELMTHCRQHCWHDPTTPCLIVPVKEGKLNTNSLASLFKSSLQTQIGLDMFLVTDSTGKSVLHYLLTSDCPLKTGRKLIRVLGENFVELILKEFSGKHPVSEDFLDGLSKPEDLRLSLSNDDDNNGVTVDELPLTLLRRYALMSRALRRATAEEADIESKVNDLWFLFNGPPVFRKVVGSLLENLMTQLSPQTAHKVDFFLHHDPQCYIIAHEPSVLLFCNTKDRKGALDEADKLQKAFQSLGLKVQMKVNLTKHDIFAAIQGSQQSDNSKALQIVVIMSHGEAGHIKDIDEVPIPIKKIEELMCPDTHQCSPKVLIVQACQSVGNETLRRNRDVLDAIDTDTMTDGPSTGSTQRKLRLETYAPTHDDFCALLSAATGQYSHRNRFIPKLATAIRNASQTDDLYAIFKQTKQSMMIADQISLLQDTMSYRLCIKDLKGMQHLNAASASN